METNTNALDLFFAQTLLGPVYSDKGMEVLSALMKSSREGNLCLLHDGDAPLPSSIVEEGKTLFPTAPIVKSENRLYLQKNWVLETYLIEQIRRLRDRPPLSFCDPLIFFQEMDKLDRLVPEQKEAIRSAFEHPFTLICGGPGTGKTYAAGRLIQLLIASWDRNKKKRIKIALAAPTGKAALHLQSVFLSQGPLDSSVRCEAFTLHRLLKLRPGETRLFSGKRIDADFVLVDEASMIDVPLFAHLLEAIGETTSLVLLGDPDQLPPIETGSLFAECSALFGIHLKQCIRTDELSLRETAEAIRSGDRDKFFKNIAPLGVIDQTLADRLYDKINPLISVEKPDPAFCLKYYQRCRVLNALRQGPFGCDILNQRIFERMERECQIGQWWAIPILITENSPRYDLYNGSSGVLIGRRSRGIDLFQGLAYFAETGEKGLVKVPPFEISFCLSIHKSQGSEFDEVIAIFPGGSENFGRESLYTAATRGKKFWEVFGEEEILQKMLSSHTKKISGLSKRFSCM